MLESIFIIKLKQKIKIWLVKKNQTSVKKNRLPFF